MKKYLYTLAFLSASFSFIGQVTAVPCACPEGNFNAPQIEGCSEQEAKPEGYMSLNAGECFANCDCAPGHT